MINESKPKVSSCLQFGSLSIRKLTPPTESGSDFFKFRLFCRWFFFFFFLEILHVIEIRKLFFTFVQNGLLLSSKLKQIDLRFKVIFYLGRVQLIDIIFI